MRSPSGRATPLPDKTDLRCTPGTQAIARRGITLSHWFSQAANYSKAHLDSHTTGNDIALIKSLGFDHVRLPIEPAPLLNDTPDPSVLNTTYLDYVDSALDMILAHNALDMILADNALDDTADNALDMIVATGLAVVIDIHPSEVELRRSSQILAQGSYPG